ncbi:MAG TPA: histidine kinase [Gammaproteobacteria bacterium]|nr:histidine kinase [Gammaproteobacteria bacterium]
MKDRDRICIRDVMKENFDMVDGMMTVQDALMTMIHVDTKTLIVEKRDENDEYGMVLISDIAKKVLALDKAPERVNIYEVMSKPVITVDPNMDIRYCARLFERFGVSRAPVIEDGLIVGVVSHTDLVLKGMCSDL